MQPLCVHSILKNLRLYEETSAEPDPNPNTNVRFACYA